MLKIIISILIGLALAILIGVVASHNTGFLVFSIGEWTIQTSANLFLLALLILIFISYYFFRFVSHVLSARKDLRRYKGRKDVKRSTQFLNNGMTALIEGEWQKAEASLKKGASYSDKPGIYYLGAAKAAQQLGATERRDEYLKLANDSQGNTPIAVGLTQAKLQLEQNQSEQALATLSNLNNLHPRQPQVKKLLLKSYLDMQDWESVIQLIPELKKQKILSAEIIHAYELKAYAGLLQKAGDSGDSQKLGKTWLTIPRLFRQELFLIDVYVQQRIRIDDHQDCEILIRKALKKNWDEQLILLYGKVDGYDLALQLKSAESMLKQHPGDAALYFTLGRLCIRNQLWGKARSYLEQCAELRPGPEVYYELARLLQTMDEPHLAADYNQKGLELATRVSHSGYASITIDDRLLLEEP